MPPWGPQDRMSVYEVARGLYMSGELSPSLDLLERGISVVVNLKEKDDSHLPKRADWSLYVHWPIEDGPMPKSQTVRALAAFVARLLRQDLKVLVHCHGGNNRSGLVVARTLIELGMEPNEAVDTVKARRGSSALSNENFVRWLRDEKPQTTSLP